MSWMHVFRILLTLSICCWRYQVAALTSEGCYCDNQQHGLVASECFNTSSSGETKDVRGESERQRWDRRLSFPFSFNIQPLLLYVCLKCLVCVCVWIWNWHVHVSTTVPEAFFCVWPVLETLNLFFSLVSSTRLLEVDREVWHSTELEDHSCTAFVCLPLQTECRLGRLLLWKFQETWLDAPTSPQVSCCCVLLRCSSRVINTLWRGEEVCFDKDDF